MKAKAAEKSAKRHSRWSLPFCKLQAGKSSGRRAISAVLRGWAAMEGRQGLKG
jgi:hypothetical protein